MYNTSISDQAHYYTSPDTTPHIIFLNLNRFSYIQWN